MKRIWLGIESFGSAPLMAVASALGELLVLLRLPTHADLTTLVAESQCTVHFDGQRSEGKVLVASDHPLCRGPFG